MDTTAYIKSHAVLSSVNPAYLVRLSNPSSVIPENDITRTHIAFPEGLAEVHVLIGNQPVAFFDRELEHELRSFPILASLCFTWTSVATRLLPRVAGVPRGRPRGKSSKSRPAVAARVLRRATTAGESPSRTHVPTGKNKRVKKGVVEIPAIRFMLEFRTPASASG
jgi:hypothetical protein